MKAILIALILIFPFSAMAELQINQQGQFMHPLYAPDPNAELFVGSIPVNTFDPNNPVVEVITRSTMPCGDLPDPIRALPQGGWRSIDHTMGGGDCRVVDVNGATRNLPYWRSSIQAITDPASPGHHSCELLYYVRCVGQ